MIINTTMVHYCKCCGRDTRVWWRINHCADCADIFREFMKPLTRVALRGCNFEIATVYLIYKVIGYDHCRVDVLGSNKAVNDKYVAAILNEFSTHTDEHGVARYKQMEITCVDVRRIKDQMDRETQIIFHLSRNNTLYQRILSDVIMAPPHDLERVHDGIIDDICRLNPLFAIRYLIDDTTPTTQLLPINT